MSGIVIHTQHVPPSQNACYRNVRGVGRAKTKRYREWAQAAGWDFKGKGKITGPYVITITIDRSRRHVLSDIANREKVLSDLLQAHGIIENDRLCESVTIRWGDASNGCLVHLEPFYANQGQKA